MWPFVRREPRKPKYAMGDKAWWQIIDGGRAWAVTIIDVLPDGRYVIAADALPSEELQFTEERRLQPRAAPPQEAKP